MRGSVVVPGALVALAFSFTAAAQPKPDRPKAAATDTAPPAGGGDVKRDPKGIKGINPFWEAVKRGDDALAARDIEGAMAAYQDAIKAEPQNPMGHYRMGEAQLTKGDLKAAEASWQTALRFAGENPVMRAKVLFVLADVKERQRLFEESKNGWTAYETHVKQNPAAKGYPETPPERTKRIDEWTKLEADYAAVKERIKQRLEEAEKKAAEDAQNPHNK